MSLTVELAVEMLCFHHYQHRRAKAGTGAPSGSVYRDENPDMKILPLPYHIKLAQLQWILHLQGFPKSTRIKPQDKI